MDDVLVKCSHVKAYIKGLSHHHDLQRRGSFTRRRSLVTVVSRFNPWEEMFHRSVYFTCPSWKEHMENKNKKCGR